jgi:hypothetical protein
MTCDIAIAVVEDEMLIGMVIGVGTLVYSCIIRHFEIQLGIVVGIVPGGAMLLIHCMSAYQHPSVTSLFNIKVSDLDNGIN